MDRKMLFLKILLELGSRMHVFGNFDFVYGSNRDQEEGVHAEPQR